MTDTVAVSIESPAPLPVTVVGPIPTPPGAVSPDKRIQRQSEDPSIPARTTFQEDLTTAGQRRINLVWEYTQAVIAAMVVFANMIVGCWQGLVVLTPGQSRAEYPVILSSSLFLIVGFYFSRTNHAAIGGVGFKPNNEYQGR